MVDCDQRHHALTTPHEWEALRLDTWLEDANPTLNELRWPTPEPG